MDYGCVPRVTVGEIVYEASVERRTGEMLSKINPFTCSFVIPALSCSECTFQGTERQVVRWRLSVITKVCGGRKQSTYPHRKLARSKWDMKVRESAWIEKGKGREKWRMYSIW